MKENKLAQIIVERDYDRFFERWATRLAEELASIGSTIHTIRVDSGPYRSYGIQHILKDNVLELDFYSAVRNGFGSIGISPAELAAELTFEKA
jgi:hypothetical protein